MNHPSDDNNQGRPKTPHDPEANPFVSFRRFADEQVASLLDMVFSLPSALLENQADRRRVVYRDPSTAEQHEERNMDNEAAKHTHAERQEEQREDQSLLDLIRKFEQAGEKMRESMEREIFGEQQTRPFVWGASTQQSSTSEVEKGRADRLEGTVEPYTKPPTQQYPEQEQDRHEDFWTRMDKESDKEGFRSVFFNNSGSLGQNHHRFSNDDGHNDESGHSDWCRRDRWRSWDGFATDPNETQALHATSGLRSISMFLSPHYSPFRIEKSRILGPARSWRDAYEDLLRASNGQQLIDEAELGQHDTQRPLKWTRGLGFRLATLERPEYLTRRMEMEPHRIEEIQESRLQEESPRVNAAVPTVEHHESALQAVVVPETSQATETEQDLYEQIWKLSPFDVPGRDKLRDMELEKTYDTSQPDGSILRTLIRQKKFADGSEESSEQTTTLVGRENPSSSIAPFATGSADPQEQSPSGIMSHFVSSKFRTTTKTLQPDGRILTKTVFKTTHPDGREENSAISYLEEQEAASAGTRSILPTTVPAQSSVTVTQSSSSVTGNEESKRSRPGGGWFWSN